MELYVQTVCLQGPENLLNLVRSKLEQDKHFLKTLFEHLHDLEMSGMVDHNYIINQGGL